MTSELLIKGALIAAVFAGTALAGWRAANGSALDRGLSAVLCVWAGVCLLFSLFLWFYHLRFPLNLDLMEGTIWQHFHRAAQGEPVYPAPSAAFVSFAYNPLFYYFSVPFSWVFGDDLSTLRLVAILGTVLAGVLFYVETVRQTGSRWWGLMAAGLFAAAYRVMDAYLDTAHADSWLVASAVTGTWLIALQRGRIWNLAGVAMLAAAFWFKQHGALFAVGGVLYLTLREGPRAWPYWLLAGLLGPLAYLLGPFVFGSHFHYFTWSVPSGWSELSLGAVRRYAEFMILGYAFLGAGAVWRTAAQLWRSPRDPGVWQVQFLFALCSGMMGSLDPGSSNNVYIPVGAWCILLGVWGLHDLGSAFAWWRRFRLQFAALAASFILFFAAPGPMIVPAGAPETYRDFLAELRRLDADVYAPSIGQLDGDYALYPAAHWVALDDIVRGPGEDVRNRAEVRGILAPALAPEGPACILANKPVEKATPVIGFLADYYVLDHDYGDRWEPLRVLPGRWDHGWPRYLYRYEPPTE